MSLSTNTLTLQEAGFVLDRPSDTLGKAIDRGEVTTVKRKTKTKVAVRTLGRAELRYFKVEAGLHKTLTPFGRKQIYRAIKNLPQTVYRLHLGPMALELDGVDKEIDARIERLGELRAAVEQSVDGDLILKGTQIPVHAIASLAKGQSPAEILEDYPSLTSEQIQVAIDYARAYPRTGRPYPERSLKRMIAAMASSGIFDVDSGEDITPQMFE